MKIQILARRTNPLKLDDPHNLAALNTNTAILVDSRIPLRKTAPNEAFASKGMNDATQLLASVEQGDPVAAEHLLELLYEELRKLATSKMAQEAAGQTLQPTALVHEAWLRLVASKDRKFVNRAHFFSAAAEAMRRILIDRARHKLRQR